MSESEIGTPALGDSRFCAICGRVDAAVKVINAVPVCRQLECRRTAHNLDGAEQDRRVDA